MASEQRILWVGPFPYARLFIVVGAAVAILQIVALVIALVRRFRRSAPTRPSLKVQAVAGAALLILFGAGAGAIHAARTVAMDAFALHRAPWDAGFAIVAQANAFPTVTRVCLLAALIFIAGLWLTLDARRRAGGGPSLPIGAITGLGLLPAIAGIWSWDEMLADAYRASVGVPFAQYRALLERGAAAARARLELFARVSSFTIVALAVVAVVLIFRLRRRVPAPSDDAGAALSRRRSLLTSAIALAIAVVLVLAVSPMRAENGLRWPPAQQDDVRWFNAGTPDVVGPDAITGGPIINVWTVEGDPSKAMIELDQHEVAADALVNRLWTMRQEFAQRHPDQEFDGVVVTVVNRDAPYRAVVSMLRAVHDAGYPHPLFTFTRHENVERPVFGRLQRQRASGARVTLIDATDAAFADDPKAGASGTLVRLSDFHAYDALARRIVELRRAGQPVVLDLADLK
ncbi:MAG TPA: hypothetical protein VKQ32_14890 [Polyangia bacterium]|nr:hypothetical protein [Polyangia bacterium]